MTVTLQNKNYYKEIKNAIELLMKRFDNLYNLELETGISIEQLEALKENQITIDELSMDQAIDLYYIAIQCGCAQSKDDNKFRHLNKAHYSDLPVTFMITSDLLVIHNTLEDLEQLKASGYDLSGYLNVYISEKRRSKENKGAFLVHRDGHIIDLYGKSLYLETRSKNDNVIVSMKFMQGLSNLGANEILYNLLSKQLFIYDFRKDEIINTNFNTEVFT